jgi:N-acetylglucosaminyldiphosphoundecaprenol N-acetyl-beta-D-mannosaminyltransferase
MAETAAGGASRAGFLDRPLDLLDMEGAVERSLAWCSASGTPRTVITVNANLLAMMESDSALLQACASGDMVLADGMSVVWAARMGGIPVPERVAGVDLMLRLLEEGSRRGLSVYLLGARQEVVTKLVEQCAASYPGLRVAGYRNGYFGEADEADILSSIRNSGAHMLFVGMPSPFKEVWCHRYREELQAPLIMGVGGSFDVVAGFVSRAPQWMQGIGMEWFWRFLMEPGKMWKRYLVSNSRFLWMSARWIFGRRLLRGDSSRGRG